MTVQNLFGRLVAALNAAAVDDFRTQELERRTDIDVDGLIVSVVSPEVS